MPKRGLEVGLIGIDGAGKSSLSEALLRLPLPTKAIYLGNLDSHQDRRLTLILRAVERLGAPRPLAELARTYELFRRRLSGWVLARKGYVVVYDRHPVEHLEPHPSSLKHFLWNILHEKERPITELEAADRYIREVLEWMPVPHTKIDVTKHDLPSVLEIVRSQILAAYYERPPAHGVSSVSKRALPRHDSASRAHEG
ncbi:MAG: hypothetical protein DMG21_07690 [Acidobacteria bacterium]|nr:MAG: hypothetical protein DMG21_07690 [Acidobacteriota bacterium]